jgi:hypothetical protein
MGELEAQLISVRLDAIDLVLGHRARLVLHLHLQVLGRHDPCRKLQDAGEFAREEPVIRVIFRHPCLKETRLLPPNGASAINEVFYHMPHLGDVEFGRNRVTVRKDKTYALGGMLQKVCLE